MDKMVYAKNTIRAACYIEKNIKNKISIASIAASVYMSEDHFWRVFKGLFFSNSSLGQICNSYTSGWYELDVTAAVENDRVNSRPKAQFRIYCNGISDNNSAWNNISFTTGDDTMNWPELVIMYND